MPFFKSYAINTAGRDFVVGDIHGSFPLVREAMRQVNFDLRNDRLFCTGDLIDRGRYSNKVAHFIQQPYVHAVRGNHDDFFLQNSPEQLREFGRTNFNGLSWVRKMPDTDILYLQELLSRLPVAIEVETAIGQVGIVHANVPTQTWSQFRTNLMLGSRSTAIMAMNCRRRIDDPDVHGIPDIARVFIGHTIVGPAPVRNGNVFAIDTGAYLAQKMLDDEGEIDGFLTICELTADPDLLCEPPNQQHRRTRIISRQNKDTEVLA